MLTRLSVRNFQSLGNVALDLAPFTVVVGASNSGKSALRRALEAVVRNDSATGRLRTGEDLICVDIELDDGTVVGWEKGGKRNAYLLHMPDGSELVQDKPGSTATPEVADLLGLDDLNFVDQFDPPYLLTEQPAQAAKALGALTNVTVLYDGIREATKRQRAHDATGKTLEGQLATATAELAGYAHLPQEGADLELASQALEAARAAGQTYATVKQALDAAARDEALVVTAESVLATTVDAAPAEALLAETGAALSTAGLLAVAADRARADAIAAAVELPPAPALPADLEDAVAHAQRLAAALSTATTDAHACQTASAAVEAAQIELTEATALLADVATCPLCGSTEGHLEAAL